MRPALVVLLVGWIATTATASDKLKIELLGPPVIDSQRDFAEVQLLKLGLPWKAVGAAPALGPEVEIIEPGTAIFDGHFDATRLPMRVVLPAGEGIVELRSMAQYGAQGTAAPRESLLEIRHLGRKAVLRIPHWQDADRNGRTDWFEARVAAILEAARSSESAQLRQTVAAVSDWQQTVDVNCGGVLPELPTVILLSPICQNALGVNTHRANVDRELTATVLHEARHAWAYRRLSRSGPAGAVSNGFGKELACLFHARQGCTRQLQPNEAFLRAQEREAEQFAQRYKYFLD